MQAQIEETVEIPPLRQNLDDVYQDLKMHGVALLENALAPQRLARLSVQLEKVASDERANGKAFLEDGNLGAQGTGPNQRVFGLIGKGEEFCELALEDQAMTVTQKLFGSSYGLPDSYVAESGLDNVLLSSMTANIVSKGGMEMMKHADQAYMPASTPYAAVVNVVWLLSDFTSRNGGTLVAPGSHLAEDPVQFFLTPPAMAPVEAPAGSAMFLDGRTWHATGKSSVATRRAAIFSYYCRPFMRQQENYLLTVSPEHRERFSEELQRLLGYEVWFTLGGADC